MSPLKSFEKWIFVVFLFLIPTQLALHFWPSWTFIFGLRVDYLAPTFYLTDLLVLVLLSLWVHRDSQGIIKLINENKRWLLMVCFIALTNIVFSSSVPVSVLKWIKIFELILVGLYVSGIGTLKNNTIYKILFGSAFLFSCLGIAQFIKGSTIGGALYFFGERMFSMSTPGIALTEIAGKEFLRAYSTFSHPNSLAGFLGVVLLLLQDVKIKRIYLIFGGLIITSCFVLSFSLGAMMAILIALFVKSIKNNKKVLNKVSIFLLGASLLASLLLPLFSKSLVEKSLKFDETISQRMDLSYLSGKMISERFLVGEGLNTFIVNTPRFKGAYQYQWFLQPVHNVYLLIFSEVGLLGLLMFCYGLFIVLTRILKVGTIGLLSVFIFILVSGTVDHYWFTLQQNLLQVSLLVGLLMRPSKL